MVCIDYLIIFRDLFRIFFATFFQKQTSKDHLAQRNLLKITLLNEKQSNLEEEIWKYLFILPVFSPWGRKKCSENILLLFKTNKKEYLFYCILDQKRPI